MAAKRKKHSTNRLLVIAMAVFVGICSFKIVGTQMKISEKQYQLNQLEKGKTDQNEAIGKAAFEQYGYGYPDEHIYIDSQAS